MKPAIAIGAFGGLCAVAGGGLAHALAAPLGYGFLAGGAIGALPALLPRLVRVDAYRCAAAIGFALLATIAAALSALGLAPALKGSSANLLGSLPLLLTAPAVYAAYLAFDKAAASGGGASVGDRVAAALAGPPLVLTLALAVAVATCAVLLIRYAGLVDPEWRDMADKFVARGVIPPLTLVLFFWGLLLLGAKAWTLWRETRQARRDEPALLRAHSQALADGEIGETEDFLDLVWKKSADFYVVPRYINWAIPILGFIGTVLGISLAADGIQRVIGSRGGVSELSTELGEALAPLGIAFDTTLIALSLSVLLMLLQTALQRWEDGMLVDYETRIRAAAPRREG